MAEASFPARHKSPIAQKCKQLFQRKIHKCSPAVATPAGEGSVLAFTLHVHRFVAPRMGAASSVSTTVSPLGRTSQLQLKSPCLPLLIHCQVLGKARKGHVYICRVSHSPCSLMLRSMGTHRCSPSPFHAWVLSPAHTPGWPRHWHQPLPYLPRGLLLSCTATKSWARSNPPKGSSER